MLLAGRKPPTGHKGVVQTLLLLPTFNSEQQLRETKTDQQKSVGVIFNKELVRDVYPLADQELCEGTEPALMRGPVNNLSLLAVRLQGNKVFRLQCPCAGTSAH